MRTVHYYVQYKLNIRTFYSMYDSRAFPGRVFRDGKGNPKSGIPFPSPRVRKLVESTISRQIGIELAGKENEIFGGSAMHCVDKQAQQPAATTVVGRNVGDLKVLKFLTIVRQYTWKHAPFEQEV